uniref:Putative aftiphilin n=1 Tax=Corethrella appendiculata TaxID=1370023 RepID=U5ER97_9DIPT
MSNQIPSYLVSNTPPPIDEIDPFDDDEDLNSTPVVIDDDDRYVGNFQEPPPIISTPPPFDLINENYSSKNYEHDDLEIPEDVLYHETPGTKTVPTYSNFTLASTILRNESPPSLILSQTNYSDDEDCADENTDSKSLEQKQVQQQEDNISIPSLNFEIDLSKSTTPIPSSSFNDEVENLEIDQSQLPQHQQISSISEQPPPLSDDDENEDCIYNVQDDNTENDFTDFTSVSNEKFTTNLELNSTQTTVTTAENNKNDLTIDDDFAQIDPTPSTDSNFISTSLQQSSKFDNTTANFDADFSRFEQHEKKHIPVANADNENTSPNLDSCLNNNNKNISDNIDNSIANVDDFDDFVDFQDFESANQVQKSTAGNNQTSDVKSTEETNDDDDDFGEFSDFQQQTSVPETTAPVPISPTSVFDKTKNLTLVNFEKIINTMFPTKDDCDNNCENSEIFNNINSKILDNLNDFEKSNAFEYQYNSSNTNKWLVKSLGIDSRNILYGAKWNSSMPRFAANLSFSPLEPLKSLTSSQSSSTSPLPSTSSISLSNNNNNNNTSSATLANDNKNLDDLTATKSSTISSSSTTTTSTLNTNVPAAQFDWNSSGLVNPLDGVQEIIHESTNNQQQQSTNDTKSKILDKEITKNPETTTITESFTPTITTTSTGQCTVRTIKLPETHIFTPNKCINPISMNVTNKDDIVVVDSVTIPGNVNNEHIDDDEIPPKIDKNIINKEYRDIEYSLDKCKQQQLETKTIPVDNYFVASNNNNNNLDEFSDFQSVPIDNEKEQQQTNHVFNITSNNFQQNHHKDTIWPDIVDNKKDQSDKYLKYSKPIIGRSPTEELDTVEVDEDEEFTDFQAATTTPAPTTSTTKQSNEPILRPSPIIMPEKINMNTPKIDWPDPGIDPDEIARIEAAFPKCKVKSNNKDSGNSSANTSNNTSNTSDNLDDDEWNDFVSSEPSVKNISQSIKPSPIINVKPLIPSSTSQTVTKSTLVDDEWTDFISNVSNPSSNFTPTSQQTNNLKLNHFNTTPKFSSWNQPTQLPPPQFNSWNNSNLYYQNTNQLYQQQQHVPTTTSQYTNNNHKIKSPQHQQIPNISLIPDLGFIGPVSSSSSSSSTLSNTTTNNKTLSHSSFLNNMMSKK